MYFHSPVDFAQILSYLTSSKLVERNKKNWSQTVGVLQVFKYVLSLKCAQGEKNFVAKGLKKNFLEHNKTSWCEVRSHKTTSRT